MSVLNFDATQVTPNKALEPVPDGWYLTMLTETELKPTNDTRGQYLACVAEIIEPATYRGQKVWFNLNVANPSTKAQEIGQGQLSAICHAVGVLRVQESAELHNKPFLMKVSLTPKREDPEKPGVWYEARNDFKGAKGKEEGNVSVAALPNAQSGSPLPAWAATKPPVVPPPAQAGVPWTNPTPAAAVTPPPTPAAVTPVQPAPATPAPAARKPRGPNKPKVPVTPVEERKFFVFLSETDMPIKTESELVAMFGKGMPAETPLLLEKDLETNEWHIAAYYKIGAAPAPVVAAPTPPPVAATPPPSADADVPPWLRK